LKLNNINKKQEKNIQVINKNVIKRNTQNIKSHNDTQVKIKINVKAPSNQANKVNMKKNSN